MIIDGGCYITSPRIHVSHTCLPLQAAPESLEQWPNRQEVAKSNASLLGERGSQQRLRYRHRLHRAAAHRQRGLGAIRSTREVVAS